MEKHYFECDCCNDEHLLKFHYDPEDDFLSASIFLNTYDNIFQRTWIAIKYIFGYKSKYGHFNCWLMSRDDAERLRNLMDTIANKDSNTYNGPSPDITLTYNGNQVNFKGRDVMGYKGRNVMGDPVINCPNIPNCLIGPDTSGAKHTAAAEPFKPSIPTFYKDDANGDTP